MPAARTKLKKGTHLEVEISKMVFGGKGLAYVPIDDSEMVMFIPNAITGQKMEVVVTNSKRRYLEGRKIRLIEQAVIEESTAYQPASVAPYITVPIDQQAALKKEWVLDFLKHTAKVEDADTKLDQFISSPHLFHYRNKMEYAFSAIGHDPSSGEDFDGFSFGFKSGGTWWKTEDLNASCGLFDKEFELTLKSVREYCEGTGLPAWHLPRKEGFFRYLVVRKSFADNEVLVSLVTSSQGLQSFDQDAFASFCKELWGTQLGGLLHTVNDEVADRAKITSGTTTLLYGKSALEERINDLRFEISLESFFQTNPTCAELLYTKATDYAFECTANGEGHILDLFCGTGTIGQIVAKRLTEKHVTGVELIEEAVANAETNAELNGLDNINFIAGDVGKFLLEHEEFKGDIDLVIMDPPRAGVTPKTLRKVLRLESKNIVYISCNPSTFARDVDTMSEWGYALEKFSIVDQFPHTAHVEVVGLLSKKE